ncbi:MAG: LamG-like jellyroll fold domain-containing protein [Isosphaeraceae bacterium]
MPDGLVSWWAADGTAADLKGLNNASPSGLTYASGKVGQTFSFDGVNDWASLGDPSSLAFTASMTIEGWIQVNGIPTSSNFGTILFRGDNRGGMDPYQLVINPNGNLQFGINGTTAGASLEAPIATGQFVHVAATLDYATGVMRLYEDGVIVAETLTTARPFGPLDPTQNPGVGIGNSNYLANYNVPFNGLIDELSVYSRALSPGEVAGISSAGGDGKVKSANYFAADFPSVGEGPDGTTTTVTFNVRRVGSLAGAASVDWATANGTATAGLDYVSASGHLDFADGESQKTVQILVNGDNVAESDETVWLVLSTTTPGYAVGGGLATIVDDDAAVSVSDVVVTEGDPRFGSLGAFVSQAGNGGLTRSSGMTYGPDGNLYVGSLNTDEVLRYSGTTGAFLGAFVTAGSGGLDSPAMDGLIFRNNLLYVAGRDSNNVLRYDATTGAFVDTFIAPGSGGLLNPKGMEFCARRQPSGQQREQ